MRIYTTIFVIFFGLAGMLSAKKCRNPKGNAGDTLVSGCFERVCSRSGKKLVWLDSFATSACCSYQRIGYPKGSTITSEKAEDGCTRVTLACEDEEGVPAIKMKVESDCDTVTLTEALEEKATCCPCEITATPSATIPSNTPPTATPVTTAPTTTTEPECQCGVTNRDHRIVGGNEASPHEYPWQIGLVSSSGSTPYCGGSLISDTWVLTAAHCTTGSGASDIYVLVGEHDYTNPNDGQEKLPVARKLEHPNYNTVTKAFDFCLLQLSSRVIFRREVQPVCLPSLGTPIADGSIATVTGWGTLQSGGSRPAKLHEVNVTTMTNAECSSDSTAYNPSDITAQMICAADGGKDSCQGDSGGPLSVTVSAAEVLIGVVSWGFGCAAATAPGVYARVESVIEWINDNDDGNRCYTNTTTGTNNTITLQGGSVPSEGNVFVNGKPVCDDGWGTNDAAVACRMLGYPFGAPTTSSRFGSVPDDFIFDDVNCDGSEETLFDCSYTSIDNCGTSEGAGVICQETTPVATTLSSSNFTIELRGGSVSTEGNLFINEMPVCDDSWGSNDAVVACRMLGYPSGTPTSRSQFGSVPSDFIFDDVNCNGDEDSLFDCSYNPNDNCGSNEGAGVICQASTTLPPTTLPPTTEQTTTTPVTTGHTTTSEPDCQCGVTNRRDQRIVGGNEASPHEYPWQIGLVSSFGSTPYCGGSLISDTWVLTAAHCTTGSGASDIYVLVGEHDYTNSNDGQEKLPVARKLEHPNYNTATKAFDFCLLQLSSRVIFRKEVQPVCLPSLGTPIADGSIATVTGWGTLQSGGSRPTKLHEVNVTTMTNAECTDDSTAYNPSDITAQMICAADSGKDSCQGDSGGPLSVTVSSAEVLIGVVSWGFGCAAATAPGVYARVESVIEWINDNDDGNRCYTNTTTGTNNTISLQGGSVPSEGNVFVNGKPVCDDGWGTNDAAVACRMLGYPFGSPTTRSRFGSVPEVFIFDDVNCDGSEETLFDCSYNSVDNCGSSEGAGVICQATATVATTISSTNFTIELRGGSVNSEGNLFVNEMPVCDDSWGSNDAVVACRMLGYPSGTPTSRSQFGSVPSVFIFDDVNCNGDEESLFECSYNPNDNCGYNEGAGVICNQG